MLDLNMTAAKRTGKPDQFTHKQLSMKYNYNNDTEKKQTFPGFEV